MYMIRNNKKKIIINITRIIKRLTKVMTKDNLLSKKIYKRNLKINLKKGIIIKYYSKKKIKLSQC